MDIWVAKQLNGTLAPTDDFGRERVRKLKPGIPVLADIRQPRNAKHHRKFWALLTTVWQATGQWDDPEDLLVELKVKLGIVRNYVLKDTGEIVKIPGSISYAKMDQMEFDKFYEKALEALCEIAGGIDHAALRAAVIEQLAAA